MELKNIKPANATNPAFEEELVKIFEDIYNNRDFLTQYHLDELKKFTKMDIYAKDRYQLRMKK